ncbi:hypothetical protein NEOLEDRAFT_1068503, partial [Neolentinus lepideus HHB14362 ss-1]
YEHNLHLLKSSENATRYKENHLATGICKPMIFSGLLCCFSPLRCFSVNLMHLLWLNLPDLFLPLWCGTIEYDKT